MEILKIKGKNVIKKTVEAIKNDQVVVCPTDTVYGLICDAANEKAVKRLFRIKKRPKGKPISIFVKDIKMAKKFAYIGRKQEKFLKRVWPGKVTVVLKPKKKLPRVISQGKNTIGVRAPKHGLVLNLVKHIGPLGESSANISGKQATTRIREVIKQFKGRKEKPDLIIDAGNLKPSKPSKVIDLTKGFKILRN